MARMKGTATRPPSVPFSLTGEGPSEAPTREQVARAHRPFARGESDSSVGMGPDDLSSYRLDAVPIMLCSAVRKISSA